MDGGLKLLEGFSGFGRSYLGLVDPLCGQEWAAELRKEVVAESRAPSPCTVAS